jgi:hypothetical protein
MRRSERSTCLRRWATPISASLTKCSAGRDFYSHSRAVRKYIICSFSSSVVESRSSKAATSRWIKLSKTLSQIFYWSITRLLKAHRVWASSGCLVISNRDKNG